MKKGGTGQTMRVRKRRGGRQYEKEKGDNREANEKGMRRKGGGSKQSTE